MTQNRIIDGLKGAGYEVAVLQAQDRDIMRFVCQKINKEHGTIIMQLVFDMPGVELFTVETDEFNDWLLKKIGLDKKESSRIITV